MIYRVYSILDKAVKAFSAPHIFRSEGEAVRAFQDAVAQEGSPFNRHRGDYCYCFLGTFDDNTGSFDSVPVVVVAEGLTVMPQGPSLASPGIEVDGMERH